MAIGWDREKRIRMAGLCIDSFEALPDRLFELDYRFSRPGERYRDQD